jgi:hypothetical protein
MGSAITNYYLHKAFPDIINTENTFRGLGYIYGCHPGSNISFVSGVGTNSKKVAYGNNRADYSFIAGGIVPGVLILLPDFPENKEDWPFLWGENEYVIGMGSSYIFLVNAAIDLLNVPKSNAQFPDFPPDDVTRTMDRDQMMWQLGISFPELPPKLEDPNRPDSAWPSNASNPEGNWTDAYGMYLVICVNLNHKIRLK